MYECILPSYEQPTLRTIWVNIAFNPAGGSTAVRFRLESGPGVTMAYVSESTTYRFTGNTQDGITICLDECLLYGSAPLVSVTYMSYSTDAPCSEIRVVPHPDAEAVEVRKCNGTTVAAFSANVSINPPIVPPSPIFCFDCPVLQFYSGTPKAFDCAPVAIENTTWGHVKALYSN